VFDEHPDLKTPSDSATIWRYMTLDKFMYLVAECKLYFSRVDRLADAWEGVWPTISIETLRSRSAKKEDRDLWKQIAQTQKLLRGVTYVNCWHLATHESAAMWVLYAGQGASIAVKSSISRLKEGLSYDKPFYIGAVEYLDYNSEHIAGGKLNMLLPFFAKRKSFVHEQEVRILIQCFPESREQEKAEPAHEVGDKPAQTRIEWDKAPDHITVQARLDTLIEEIRISPTAPPWMKDVLAKTTDRFGLGHKPLYQSSLQEPYMY
jgi:hypothetical protein